MPRPVLVSQETHLTPSPAAMRVIEQLRGFTAGTGSDPDEMRLRYAESRRPFLPELDSVGDILSLERTAERPPLTIFRPSEAQSGQIPALLYLHGGGWTVGSLDTYEPFCRKLANATGCAVIWVEYRLAPEHPFPAPYLDIRDAYRWILSEGEKLGLDTGRIGVAGDSSGGNLAAVLCLAERDDATAPLPWLQVLIYPCLDMTASLDSHKLFATGYGLTGQTYRWYRENYAGGITKPGQWRLSPLRAYNLAGLPPTVMLYAGFDILRDEAAAYADRLEAAEVPVERLYFPDMIHGFITLGGAIPAAETAIHRIGAGLRRLTQSGLPASLGHLRHG